MAGYSYHYIWKADYAHWKIANKDYWEAIKLFKQLLNSDYKTAYVYDGLSYAHYQYGDNGYKNIS